MEILLVIIVILLFTYILKTDFLKKVYTDSTNGISIISNGKVVDCNKKLLDIFQYDSKKEFLEEHPLKLAPVFQSDGKLSLTKAENMMKIAKSKGNCCFDWICLNKNTQEKHIEIDIIKIDSFLNKERYFMIWRDIEKRVEMEKKLKLLNENLEDIIEEKVKNNKKQEEMILQQTKQAQIGEMLSMIAHQWRQPLGAISASTIDMQMKIMLKNLDSNALLEYIIKELQSIESFTQVLTNTIDDFRDFYKFTKDKQKISIMSPIKKSYQIIEKYFEEDQINIEIICMKEVIVSIYESEIIQVILSILQNSRDNFIQKDIKNPKVIIMVEEDQKNNLLLKIFDNGKGIKKENLDKIFQPYFTTKDKMNGTGLGLYIAQKIIQEHHDGTIDIQNQTDGICTTIKLKKDI